MEAFIGGLPQSIEGNVTASKLQTLEEATNMAHRLMDQIIKRNSVQETNDHKRKLRDVAVYYHFAISTFPVKIMIKSSSFILEYLLQLHIQTWVYFLNEKSQAFEAFKKFKAMVEKEKGLKIKSMRSDRGGEFLSKEFNKFCEDNGIRRFLMALYSPQQNGVVERKNRTILNMV
ncbi:retrovirus-related pol polyprotein from transposon TNT 1-94 [Tanacetum coccineum]